MLIIFSELFCPVIYYMRNVGKTIMYPSLFEQVGEYHSVLHLILREVPHQQSLPWERPASTTSDGLAEIVLPLGM